MSVRQTCGACGWTTKPGTPAKTAYAISRHSCDRTRRRREAAARAEIAEAMIDRTPQPCLHPQTRHEHGTRACYVHDRCRCLPCAAAASRYETTRTRRNAYGRSNIVDSAPVRLHLQQLAGAGLGRRQIAAQSGVAASSIQKIQSGRDRIQKITAAKILAVPLPLLDDLAPHALVPTIGSTRRIRALATLGWSAARLAAELGVNRQRLDRLSTADTTSAETAVMIETLYDRLWCTPAPCSTPADRAAATRTRDEAARRGWSKPLEWDDDTIDDPAAEPLAMVPTRRGIDDLVDDIAQALVTTDDPEVIARRLGYSNAEVLRRRLRQEGRAEVLPAIDHVTVAGVQYGPALKTAQTGKSINVRVGRQAGGIIAAQRDHRPMKGGSSER